MKLPLTTFGLEYGDVYITPQYSGVTTRQQVDVTTTLYSRNKKNILYIGVPIISANMKDVTESKMCNALHANGAIGALHRFMSIKENVEEFKQVVGNCFVSVGVNRDSQERAKALVAAGAKYFIIDIAHGHSRNMANMLGWFETVPNRDDLIIIAGNVATSDGVSYLREHGADVAKIGVGPGAVCLTRSVTGVTVPQFSAVYKCAQEAGIPLIADGGITEIGDMAKAIGAGAALCMSGKFFANCIESSAARTHDGKVIYRGSASKTVQEKYRTDDQMPTPEGKSMALEGQVPVTSVVADIAGGLRSAYSYVGACNTEEFQKQCLFGIKHNRN